MTVKRRRRRAQPAIPAEPVKIADVLPGMASEQLVAATTTAPTEGGGAAEAPAPASSPVAEQRIPAQVAETTPATSAAAPRRRRKSIGTHALKLSAPPREGYKRRFVNDDGNRLAEMQELGYDFVSDTGIKTADPGSRVSRLVGTKANGEPLHAYLMETPDELYAEGQAEKEAANRQIDESITAGRDSTGRLENQYGHGSITTDR